MAVSAQDIKDRFDEFDDVDSSVIDLAIAEAGRRINSTQWGPSKTDDGTLYLACHLLKFGAKGDGLASGPMTAKRVGDVSAAFAVADIFKRSALAATAYGRYFLDLQSTVFPTRVL